MQQNATRSCDKVYLSEMGNGHWIFSFFIDTFLSKLIHITKTAVRQTDRGGFALWMLTAITEQSESVYIHGARFCKEIL